MKTIMKLFGLASFVFSLILTSCVKDGLDGAIGPQGEQGIQGEQGEQGIQGPEGTANIMYSDWIDQDINFLDFSQSKTMRINETKLTREFFDNGGFVLGFYRFIETSHYTLPYISPFGESMRSMQTLIFNDGGEVRFTIQSTDGTELTDQEVHGGSINEQMQYKYVLIPGGTNITGKSQPNFKKMTYYQVMDYFDLEY